MSEEILVRQGAPTLAGIKTGSLFPCPCEDKEALFADIRRLNRLLVPKGLCLLPIRFLKGQVLLYLYRPSELRRDLENEQAAEILHHAGYNSGHCGRCIANLIRRFREGGEFPHEVGLFLSYPPEDVKGFIDHRACNFKCAGLWKGLRRREEGTRAVRPLQKMHGDLLRTLGGRLGHRAACRGSVIDTDL